GTWSTSTGLIYLQRSRQSRHCLKSNRLIYRIKTSSLCLHAMASAKPVVTFVRSRLAKEVLLTDICAQLMDECIAKDAHSSPLGLDNMTVIIAQLKPTMWQSPPLPPKESCEASFTFDKPTH
ncbi:unnamed protein product, partial [Closterium sp. NIES-64]